MNNNCRTNLGSINSNHKYKHNNRAVEPDFDLSKEFMTTKAQLLALVNRLEHVEKELMMRKYMTKKPPLERVIYEEALELARLRNWSVGFTLSIMWSRFKRYLETLRKLKWLLY